MLESAPFEVVRPLGKGAMGAVYEVRLPGDPRRLVAKVLTRARGSQLERFRREGQVVARLDAHPGIVSVHSSGVLEDGTPYLLFDLVEGESLDQLFARERGLSPAGVLRLGLQLAGALAHAHRVGVIHRDIKPENILVAKGDEVLLADFGVALAGDHERLTMTGFQVGTPLYMAPEQVLGKKHGLGPWTDVHAVGLVLDEAWSGELPWAAETPMELQAGILTLVPDLLESDAEHEQWLSAVIRRCLEKDPQDRYQDAGELLEDLRRIHAGQPPAQAPARRRAARRVVVGLALVLAAVGIVGGGGASLLGPSPEQVLASARSEVVAAEDRLLDAEPQEPETLRPLETRLADLADAPEVRALQGRLLAVEGQLALRRGDVSRASELLEQALALAAPGGKLLRELERVHLAALRGGLVALGEGDTRARVRAIQDLAGAIQRQPKRVELYAWQAQVLLRDGRPDEALSWIRRAPGPVDVETRFAVLVAAGNLDEARALADQVSQPGPRAELGFRQAEVALKGGDLQEARRKSAQGMEQDPQHPLRDRWAKQVQALLQEVGRWSSRDPRSHDLMRREVAAHSLRRVLDPEHVIPRERMMVMGTVIVQAIHLVRSSEDGYEFMCDLISLGPGYQSMYEIFSGVARDRGYPHPERDLAVLREGMRLSGAAHQQRMRRELSKALATLGRNDELFAVAHAELEAVGDWSKGVYVLGRYGQLFTQPESKAETDRIVALPEPERRRTVAVVKAGALARWTWDDGPLRLPVRLLRLLRAVEAATDELKEFLERLRLSVANRRLAWAESGTQDFLDALDRLAVSRLHEALEAGDLERFDRALLDVEAQLDAEPWLRHGKSPTPR